MTIDEVYQRAVDLKEHMRELERECDRLEARHAEVVALMRKDNEAMEGLLRHALDIDGNIYLC